MRRVIVLSANILIAVGGTTTAAPNWIDNLDLYDAPSSGCLGCSKKDDATVANVGLGRVSSGSLGPSTMSFENPDGVSWAVQEEPVPKFNARWSLDDWMSGHPHRAQNHIRQRRHGQSLWTLMGL
jgi:hypothetical protein